VTGKVPIKPSYFIRYFNSRNKVFS